VLVGGYAFTIVGVLARMPINPLFPVELNSGLYIPLAAAGRLLPGPGIQAIVGRVGEDASPAAVGRAINTWFQPRTRGQGVQIRTAEQLIAGMERQQGLYGTMLSMIAGISLIVGGAGVMNVMLVAVAERRPEIGIRLAIGARRRDIRALFLTEATMLSGLGGLAGIALGLLAAWILAEVAVWPFAVDPMAIFLGTGCSVLIGMAAGVVPAIRAARLDPISALRVG
jgi:putative ABC transport system permease protein